MENTKLFNVIQKAAISKHNEQNFGILESEILELGFRNVNFNSGVSQNAYHPYLGQLTPAENIVHFSFPF